jgi:dCTP deaminase
VEALRRDDLSQRLFIVPYYGLRPFQAATVDIRLGNWFRIARRTRATSIDLTNKAELRKVRQEQQSEVYVPFGQHFTLHPGDFALAVSLEYVAIPPDLVASVEGKSGLGRAGLIVATATPVAPGFKGGVVLELFNSGTVPLILKPGMQIAQLAFFQTDRPLPAEWLYSGKFHCQIKP